MSYGPQADVYGLEYISVKFVVQNFDLLEEEKNCCICMEDKLSEDICKLNCSHKFCVECINTLLNNNHTCPICRINITQICTQTINARYLIHH